jgi:hypothetical protein
MRRSAFRLVSRSGAVDALLLMAHPQHWPNKRQFFQMTLPPFQPPRVWVAHY